ncbi:hypothetical protein PN466_12715 [Roseofilum reptotaenium CS-1145]|nr:hypothetical protein [Roseofilum reptotaenium CS-1145]
MQIEYYPSDYYPSAKDLPNSDEIPMDNELQDLIATLPKPMLASI